MLRLCLLLSTLAGASCHGDERMANHLLLLESLPDGFTLHKPTFLDIRTNLSGTVRVVEATEFRVVINVSAPSLEEAYGVKAELTAHNLGLLLQVHEESISAVSFLLTWLGVGIGGATVLVFIITSICVFCWYSSERSLYDLAEKKSCASSSHRSGVYRSRNSVQLGHVAPLSDLPPLHEDPMGQHGDDQLKHLAEKSEEEVEAIEMEELTQQKLKDLEGSSPADNERAMLTTQEKNSIKSQFHAQSKNVHKDLLKKDKTANKPPARRRTANGTYSVVATSPDNGAGLSEESMESEVDADQEVTTDIPRERVCAVQSSLEGCDVHKPLTTFMSPSKVKLGLGGMNSENRLPAPVMDCGLSDDDTMDLELTVMADVHKTGSTPEIIKVSTPERLGYPGMGPAFPHEPARPTLTTFSSPAQTAVSPHSHTKAIRFKEPLDNDSRFEPQNVAVAQRSSLLPRFPTGFAAMGNIPEDPREDYDSAQSESGQSRSMYGSSEIFDAAALEQTYFNLEDSDIDIPPLDAEDILSDGGLPSPLTPSITRGRMTQDDSNVQGQRAFFFSRDHGFCSLGKPRPYSSIIVRPEQVQPSSDSGLSSGISSDQTSTPVNSEPDSTSPKLPPPPLGLGEATQDVSAFEFPPPPKYFASPQHIGWNSPVATSSTTNAGDYVTLPNNSTKGTDKSPSRTRGSGTGRHGFGSNYMNLTVLSVACLLTVTSGVYSKMSGEETRVDITVFAPKPFLSAQKNTIFFNQQKHTDLNVDEGFDFDAFVMQDPVLAQTMDLCDGKDCEDHGCDVQTGQCICRKGYRMSEDNKCTDINECAEGLTKCHSSAGCLNRKGSYDCVCSIDYYGDGKTCHDCNTPCREDQYEVQPCSKNSQKICKDCTKECHKGFYKARNCTDNNNAICRVCQPTCLQGQYEFRTCSSYHDRQCANVSLLPDVEGSDNVIMENDRYVQESEVIIEDQPSQIVSHSRYSLNRGTLLHVDISIQNLEVAQRYVPLEVPNLNMSAGLPDVLKSSSVQHFCLHPVPDYYILHYTKHEDVTYNISDDKEVSPCQTFKDYGNFPADVLRKENSFLCTEPGPLTKLFEITSETFQTTTVWAEKLKRCADQNHKCETCTKQCAQQMSQTNADCSVVGDNNDNGWSPRLQVCYNCCARSNCNDACYNKLHRRRCNPFKCHHGNLIEFSIFPSWNGSQNGKFYCHIQPVAKQRLLEITYTVRCDGRSMPVHTASVQIDGGEEWEKSGQHHYRDDLLNIVIDSNLGKLPDFLEGTTPENSRIFSVGSYVQEGSLADVTALSGKRDFIFLHPVKPFGIHLTNADKNKCESQILKESLVAGDYKKPYIPNLDLHVVPFQNTTLPFLISNPQKPPFVKVSLAHGSFLRHIFPTASLERDSLTGNMRQNTSHWTVEVLGSVKECPGYLKVILSDPAYRHTPLYSVDVAVTCPHKFHLKFYLPAGDEPGAERQVVASIVDAQQVHSLHLHKPASIKDKREENSLRTAVPHEDNMEKNGSVTLPEGFIFSTFYMVSVGGATVLLLCLLFIGLIVQPGVPAPEPPVLKCHHALFTVIYIVFHFFYSLAATSSVFFLIVIAVNSPRVSFILQHRQQAAATTAAHQLELTAMHTFLRQEIQQQNTHMDDMRSLCRLDMQVLVDDMKKLHDKLLLRTEDVFKKHHLHSLLEKHKHRSLQQLSQDLTSYREKYDTIVRTMLRQLNHDIDLSYRSIENNTWLAGARFLHGAVMNIRKNINNVETKPFLEWASLQADLKKLTFDVSFSLPALPKLRDIEEVMESPETQQVKRSSRKQALPVSLKTARIYNQWYTPFSNNQSANLQSDGQQPDGGRSQRFHTIFYIFLGILVFLDCILLLHRVLKAYSFGRLLLYGFPEYMDFRERKEEGDDDVFDDGGKCRYCKESTFCQAVRAFFSQLISSTFVPKAVIVVAMGLLLRGVLHVSESSLTLTALRRAGLYHSSEDYLDLHAELINGRVKAHAEHINTVDFPAYQTWMSTYIQRHQFAFQLYQQQLELMQNVHLHTYCQYLQSLGLAENCVHGNQENNTKDSALGVILPTCQFQPVLPKFYKRSESMYRNLAERQLKVILENVQAVIFDTCQVIVVFISVIVFKELLCGVVWIFIRRSGLIRLRIIYETDHDEQAQAT